MMKTEGGVTDLQWFVCAVSRGNFKSRPGLFPTTTAIKVVTLSPINFSHFVPVFPS